MRPMRFGIDLPTTGDYADVRLLAELAAEADRCGWDGFFVYDQVASETPEPLVDPWIALAAVALATSSLRLGALVTPLARRRPWKVWQFLPVSGGVNRLTLRATTTACAGRTFCPPRSSSRASPSGLAASGPT